MAGTGSKLPAFKGYFFIIKNSKQLNHENLKQLRITILHFVNNVTDSTVHGRITVGTYKH